MSVSKIRAVRRIAVPAALLVGAAFVTTPAPATEGSARLVELRTEVERAQGPEVYGALRAVWQEWDRTDPTELEALLHTLSTEGRISPAARTYAGLLEAYARRRRGDLAGSHAHLKQLGFVEDWLVVGPFDNEGKGGFNRAFGPEEEGNGAIDLVHPYQGKERPTRYRLYPQAAATGWVDFGSLVRPQENVCAYAVTFVQGKKDPTHGISVWAGGAGAMRVWLNGKEVLRDEKYRSLDADRVSGTGKLEKGYNRVLVKACGTDQAPIFTLRIGKPDGSPDADLEVHADPTLSAADAGTRGPKPEMAKTAPTMGGPVPAFEQRIKGGDAHAFEKYARYLVQTSGDDPAERKAREYASKAAEKDPTIARLLLAGELAENRNQRSGWIEKAEARVNAGTPVDEKVKVLLARAAYARSGANWRDCIPYYEKALALEPENLTAILARVELYGEAGLKETAIALLERTLARRPKSVALLRALAAELREAGRTVEANEVMERYAQLRFDDPSFVKTQLDLALARRDAATARRFATRLVALAPDDASTLQAAAKTHVALGDRPSAIAAYRRALELSPEDADTLRALADLYGVYGQKDEQEKLLRRILEVKPQDKDVREYLAHMQPPKPRADENYARPAAEFLKDRGKPADGQGRRTLVDLQVTTVFPNGLSSRFHQVAFQPLTDATAAEARQYAFGYEGDTETVQLRGARIHRKNGTIDEATDSGETAADDPNMAMYTSGRAFYVNFPRIFPGDVVELQYRVEDVAERNNFNDYFGEVNYMQSPEPVTHSEYVLITPKTRKLVVNKPNIPGLVSKVEEKGEERIYRFTAENVPPMQREPLQPPYPELLGHVHVSTYQSWDEMGRWYWGLVKDQFVADDEVKRRVAEITKGLTDEKAKVRAVYDYVVQKTRYVALEFGIHGFKPYRCAQIFARGFGDCKDKATLIVTMLKELGIPATIVIVRTGMRGDFDTEPASLAPFDHAIAYVPSMNLFLDGTAEYTGSTELPAMDRGALALLVNEGKPKLVHMPDPPASESVTTRKIDAQVNADGGAQLAFSVDVTGVNASSYRQRYQNDSTRKSRITEDVGAELPGVDFAKIEANDMTDVEKPIAVRAKGKIKDLARKDGETASLSVGPKDYMVKEYASLSQRKRDIRISAQTTSVTEWTFHLPAGAKIQSAPQKLSGKSDYGTYAVDVDVKGNDATVRTTIAITKTRITAAEYPKFRAYCEEVDRALGQRLVYTR